VKSLVLCLALAVSALAADAVTIAGAWNVDGSVYGNAVKFDCTLAQEGDKLTGTAKIQEKDVPITGTVKDKEVTFQFEILYNNSPLTLVFTGTLASETDMKGTIAVAGVTGEFTAKRQ
jgi:hypothetical protein